MTRASPSSPAAGSASALRRRTAWRRKRNAARIGREEAEVAAPAPPDPRDSALTALEDVLVSEIRLAQTVDALAEQERRALQSDAPAMLAEAVRARLTCLGELSRLETERDAAVARCALQAGLPADTTFEELLPHLEPAAAQRLSLYRLGVEAHLEHCRALRPANRALAHAAIERHETWQQFLLRQAAGSSAWPVEPLF